MLRRPAWPEFRICLAGLRAASVAVAAAAVLAGCQNPLRQDADAELQRSLDATLSREAGSAIGEARSRSKGLG